MVKDLGCNGHTSALRKAWATELKAAGWVLQLAAASAGAGPVVCFGLVPSTQGSVLGLPTSTCLADASVLDATIATAPPAGFSHSWGHRMAASPGQDFLLLGGTDRRRLETVYTLLLHRPRSPRPMGPTQFRLEYVHPRWERSCAPAAPFWQ